MSQRNVATSFFFAYAGRREMLGRGGYREFKEFREFKEGVDCTIPKFPKLSSISIFSL
jgi:hypothetical protein